MQNCLKWFTDWKSEGNDWFAKQEYRKALSSYNKAITVIRGRSSKALTSCGINGRDVAIMFSNRAEALLKLGRWEEAIAAADDSVAADSTWFKVNRL